jgi:hypothetical protein
MRTRGSTALSLQPTLHSVRWAFASPGPLAQISFREGNAHEVLIGSIHDLDAPTSSILAFSVTRLQTAMSEFESFLKSRLKIGQRGTLRVLLEGAI